jgi:hypothetical protein
MTAQLLIFVDLTSYYKDSAQSHGLWFSLDVCHFVNRFPLSGKSCSLLCKDSIRIQLKDCPTGISLSTVTGWPLMSRWVGKDKQPESHASTQERLWQRQLKGGWLYYCKKAGNLHWRLQVGTKHVPATYMGYQSHGTRRSELGSSHLNFSSL